MMNDISFSLYLLAPSFVLYGILWPAWCLGGIGQLMSSQQAL